MSKQIKHVCVGILLSLPRTDGLVGFWQIVKDDLSFCGNQLKLARRILFISTGALIEM